MCRHIHTTSLQAGAAPEAGGCGGRLAGRRAPCRPEHHLCAEQLSTLSGEPGIGGGAGGEATKSPTPL